MEPESVQGVLEEENIEVTEHYWIVPYAMEGGHAEDVMEKERLEDKFLGDIHKSH